MRPCLHWNIWCQNDWTYSFGRISSDGKSWQPLAWKDHSGRFGSHLVRTCPSEPHLPSPEIPSTAETRTPPAQTDCSDLKTQFETRRFLLEGVFSAFPFVVDSPLTHQTRRRSLCPIHPDSWILWDSLCCRTSRFGPAWSSLLRVLLGAQVGNWRA